MKTLLLRILGWGLLAVLCTGTSTLNTIWAQTPTGPSEVRIEIKEIKVDKKLDKDVVEVIGSTNLPPEAILEMTVTSEIFSLDTATLREEIVTSKYIEIDGQRRFDGVLSDFTRTLPPAIYTVKLSVSARQREKVKKAIPQKCYGETITQQKLLIGDLKQLITYTREKYQQLTKAIEFVTTISHDLAKWVDLYNGLTEKADFRKKYKDDFTAWQSSITSKMNQTMEQAATYTVSSLPYLYRTSNLEIVRICGTLRDQESIFTGLISERPIVSGDPQRSQPPKTDIPKQAALNIKNLLTKDTLFGILLIACYQSEAINLVYEGLKEKTEKKTEWDKYQAKVQPVLTELTEYYKTFQKSLTEKKEQEDPFKPIWTLLDEYLTLLKQKAESMTALMEGPEKPEEIERLNQILTEAGPKMREIFNQLRGKLAEPR